MPESQNIEYKQKQDSQEKVGGLMVILSKAAEGTEEGSQIGGAIGGVLGGVIGSLIR